MFSLKDNGTWRRAENITDYQDWREWTREIISPQPLADRRVKVLSEDFSVKIHSKFINLGRKWAKAYGYNSDGEREELLSNLVSNSFVAIYYLCTVPKKLNFFP